MEWKPSSIEDKWKRYWKEHQIYRVSNDSDKEKFYVLDMFPYPSGSGLHVGHPLGYIASDIYSRYQRMNGYNVLHPMGFDAFGLPAEQYAIQTGQHPSKTTAENIAMYKSQLDNIGFSYDWDRQVITSDADYYHWTQWIFLELYDSWYNKKEASAQKIERLVQILNTEGNQSHPVPGSEEIISADEWLNKSESQKELFLMQYRLAYLSYATVNWCEELGTVLANDEVINGRSERGGYPVVKRKMRQWFLRITDYADRLLEGLENLDWSDSIKEIQRNWIGKSHGAELRFAVENHDAAVEVFTTRPDTIYGVSFMVLAPEHPLVEQITTSEQSTAVQEYLEYVATRSERERMADVESITGVYTGAQAIHPLTGNTVPIWISEYVLINYGTGAIMAVPAGDDRDLRFAHAFDIPVRNIFGKAFDGQEALTDKNVELHDSDFLSGKSGAEAISEAIDYIQSKNLGKAKVNYRFHDAGFSRQRYWGEPFPIHYRVQGVEDAQFENLQGDDVIDIPVPLKPNDLPLHLPNVESYEPRGDGRSPLASNEDWMKHLYETDTMPGYAGSSWYFMRYTDPQNTEVFASKEALNYWGAVDVYFGGAEHAVGHLLYARMWTKVLFDLGHLPYDEPFQKLINQGMVQGQSKIAHRITGTNTFVSFGLINERSTDPIHVDVSMVNGDHLDIEAFRNWRSEFSDASFELEDDKFVCQTIVEKMSKRYFNVVNPDDVVKEYGADTFRMYEMFLGPIDMAKPWDTKGIEGVFRFMKKLWRLCIDENGSNKVVDEPLNAEEEKLINQTIKKTREDIQNFSFNTSVSQFMITVNQMQKSGLTKKDMIQKLVLCMAPFAPFTSEEIYQEILGNEGSVFDAAFPDYDESKLVEETKTYPVAINGKTRTELDLPADISQEEAESVAMADEVVKKWVEGKEIRKIVFVPGRMINIVVS